MFGAFLVFLALALLIRWLWRRDKHAIEDSDTEFTIAVLPDGSTYFRRVPVKQRRSNPNGKDGTGVEA